jgi:pimeloyl-ACP methyl ester carboxylesterase
VPIGLLLLHAFPVDASMWAPQLAAVRGDVAVAAPNFPGFGGTPLSGQVSTMDDAADLAEVEVAASGVDRVVVCGLSMGGYVAFAFWRKFRDRVAGMILAHTRAGPDDEAGRERRRALATRLRAEGNAFLVESPPPLLSSHAPNELWDHVKSIIAAQSAEAIAAASLGLAERPDSTADLAGIDVPTLVITSTDDALIPSDATSPMADQIPGAQLEVIEGAGHLSNLEAPREFNHVLRAHLIRCGVLTG